MKQKIIGIAAVVLMLAILAGASAATNYGSQEDPLVTLSYLEQVFKPQLISEMETSIEAAKQAADSDFSQKIAAIETAIADAPDLVTSAQSYSVVRMAKGEVLKGSVGTELMLRIGSANCYAESATGIIDITMAKTLENGNAMQTNHMYMVTIEGRGMTATSDVMVLVRGAYTIS